MGHAVKTLERESASKLRENDGNAQFSFCLIADTTKCRIASEARSGISFLTRGPRITQIHADFPGSARVSRAGEAVPGSRTFSRVVSVRRRNQRPRRRPYPIA